MPPSLRPRTRIASLLDSRERHDRRLSPCDAVVRRRLVLLLEVVPRDVDEAQAQELRGRRLRIIELADENDVVALFLTGDLEVDPRVGIPRLGPRPRRLVEDVDA